MQGETPVWKFTAIAVAFVAACFFLGYFVLGPSARPSGATGAPAQGGGTTTTPSVPITPPPVVEPRSTTVVQVEERTDEIEAERRLDEERRKAEKEAEKKRRDEEKKKRDDAKKKRDDEEKRRDDEAAADRDDPDAASEAPNAAAPGDAPGPQNPPPDTEPTRPSPEPKPLPPAPEPEPSASSVLHRVRVGTFEKRDNAQALATELSGRGFQAVTSPAQVNGKTVYHVQVGAFRNETEARNQQKALERNGYDTTLSSSR